MDLVRTIRLDLEMLGFSDESLRPLNEHERNYAKKDGPWFINAENYKIATTSSLQVKLVLCANVLAAEDASKDQRNAAADILFKAGDSDALAIGIETLLTNDKLMSTYEDHLVSAATSVANGFRLELQGKNLTVELPEAVMGLLARAESFNLAGNQFSNVIAGTVLYDMVYDMKRWLHAKFDWRGRELTGFDGLAGVLHTGEFLAPGMDTGSEISIKKLRGDSELDLSGRKVGADAAAVIASLIATNTLVDQTKSPDSQHFSK